MKYWDKSLKKMMGKVIKMDTTQKNVNERIYNIISALEEISADTGLPGNVRAKLMSITETLKNNSQNPLTINQILDELDELSLDTNLEPFTRTQIFNIISMLEFL